LPIATRIEANVCRSLLRRDAQWQRLQAALGHDAVRLRHCCLNDVLA
jgi:hypothetical protein